MRRSKNAMVRAGLAVLLSSSMTMNALASTVTTTGTVDVETTAGKSEAVDVTITIDKTENSNGSTTVHTSSNAKPGYVTGSGMKVEYSSEDESTTSGGITTGHSKSEYTSTSETEDSIYTAAGGSETSVTVNPNVNQTVDVPLTDVDDPDTEKVENQNSVTGTQVGNTTLVEGSNKPEDLVDGNYDYTTETVVNSMKVTITTDTIEINGKIITPAQVEIDSDGDGVNDKTVPMVDFDGDGNYDMTVDTLKYIYGDVKATDSNNNDMIYWGSAPEIPEEVEDTKGYGYVLVGGGNIGQYWGAYLSKTPNKDYPDPVYIDENGQKYYFPEIKNWAYPGSGSAQNTLTELYIDGQKVSADSDGALSSWDIPEQYILVDAATGELITTYCADIITNTEDGYSYYIENLEDAKYYEDDEAAMIRKIANVGYWGTSGDANTFGSLAAMKQMMKDAVDETGANIFTEADIELLTDGIALSATQMAIWSFSNKMGDIVFVNSHYAKDNNALDSIVNYSWGSTAIKGGMPDNKEKGNDLLFKLYNYLINLDPMEIKDDEKNTSNTVINANNFIKDLDVTVIKKAEEHENSKDADDTNDAYVTNLTFALVVEPSTENGDDLVVKVLDADGNLIASGRVAGTLKEGETKLEQDEHGNYSFKNITLIEGEQNFNLTLEGIQNLDHGVYLYSSEVRPEKDKNGNVEQVSSQTLVGVAQGERAVSVSMDIKFELNVDDEVIATEHVWRDEETTKKPPKNDDGNSKKPTIIDDPETPLSPTPLVMFEEEEVPLSDVAVLGAFEIEDDMIPLAVLPATGDNSLFLMFMSLLSGLSLAGASLVDKMKKRKR